MSDQAASTLVPDVRARSPCESAREPRRASTATYQQAHSATMRRQTGAVKPMGSPQANFQATQRFSGLDGLRAISVVAVIWHHVGGYHGSAILGRGHHGVDMFFAISGFLITTLLLREYSRFGAISLRNFYARRALRIFPLYYAVLAVYCLLTFLTMRDTPKAAQFWDNLPSFVTYTSNWFVDLADGGVTFYFAWSLATEEQFYLLWPPALLLTLAGPRWLPIAAAFALLAIQVLASSADHANLLMTVAASLSPAILLGAALAVLLNIPSCFDRVYAGLGHRAAAPVVLGAMLIAISTGAPPLAIDALMALLVASVCVREDTLLHPVLKWRPLAFLGVISYGIYLMHMLAANVVRRVVGHDSGVDVFVLTLLLVTLAAYLSYRYFESPILSHARRFRSGVPRTEPPATSATEKAAG